MGLHELIICITAVLFITTTIMVIKIDNKKIFSAYGFWWGSWIILTILGWCLNEAALEDVPVIKLPTIAIYVAIFISISGISFEIYRMCWYRSHGKVAKGVAAGFTEETTTLVTEGPFKIVRHPETLAWIFLVPSLIVSLSLFLPILTSLAITGIVTFIISSIVGAKIEEKYNVRKFGRAYQQYMMQTPAFNFIKGLWNLRKKR